MPFKDECGVFGIWPGREASRQAYLGLYALQHRGQESAGVSWIDHGNVHSLKGMGLVHNALDQGTLSSIPASSAILPATSSYSITKGTERLIWKSGPPTSSRSR